MTIDCRQCRLLLENNTTETELALLEHLEQCPECARQLENDIAREGAHFPAPCWEAPPAWSPHLAPTCTRQEVGRRRPDGAVQADPTCTRQEVGSSQPVPTRAGQPESAGDSLWNRLNTALRFWRPAFAGLALAGLLFMVVLGRTPVTVSPIPQTAVWSFFSPQDLISSPSFIHEIQEDSAFVSHAEPIDGTDPAGFSGGFEYEHSSEEEPSSLISRKEWSFLDSGNSFTFIDEEETS